jgi:hypothetical protein
VAAYWSVEIPHPEVARAPVTATAQTPDVPTDIGDDLAIRLRRAVEVSREAPV